MFFICIFFSLFIFSPLLLLVHFLASFSLRSIAIQVNEAPPLRPGITWMRLENIARLLDIERTMFVEKVRWIVILAYERVYDR